MACVAPLPRNYRIHLLWVLISFFFILLLHILLLYTYSHLFVELSRHVGAMSGMSADPPRSLLLASILKTMPFLQVHGFPRPAAFVFPLLTDLPLLGQAYVDMARGFVLKFYMILAALMNSLFVKLRTLTQGETKTEKKNRCGGVHFPQLREGMQLMLFCLRQADRANLIRIRRDRDNQHQGTRRGGAQPAENGQGELRLLRTRQACRQRISDQGEFVATK